MQHKGCERLRDLAEGAAPRLCTLGAQNPLSADPRGSFANSLPFVQPMAAGVLVLGTAQQFSVNEGSASTVPDVGQGRILCDEHAIMGSLLRRGPLTTAIPR